MLAPAAVFVSGYVTMWTLFSVVATVAQWGLERAALLSPMMVSTSPTLGAALLIGAGIYQFTPYKDGVITSRKTFQKYYAQSEFRNFLETSLGVEAIAVGQGIFILFKDKIDKEYFEDLYVKQFSLYFDNILARIDLQIEAYGKEANIPQQLFDILKKQHRELSALKEKYGPVATPQQLEKN